MATHARSVARKRWTGQQSGGNGLRLDLERRRSARVVREMFDGRPLPDSTLRYGISRAQNGDESNPVYRLVAWFDLARKAGHGRDAADAVIAYLDGQAAHIWSEGDDCFHVASAAEQEIDGLEDVVQLRAAREPGVVMHYVEIVETKLIPALKRVARAGRAYAGRKS